LVRIRPKFIRWRFSTFSGQMPSPIASPDVQVSTLPIYDKNIPAKHRKVIELLQGKDLEKFNEYMEKFKKIPFKDFLEAADSPEGEIVAQTEIVSSNPILIRQCRLTIKKACLMQKL